MKAFIDIKPGQWVLAFDEHYGPHEREMPEHLEMFSKRGGGWDSHGVSEIFHVYEVIDAKPKPYHPRTYTIGQSVAHPRAYLRDRQYRGNIIAVGTKETMIALRDRLFAIGEETDDAIEAEMYRRIEKFAERKHADAERKIRRLLPQHFGRQS
ncbi:hypothetical protein G6M87_09125 [Rhizobium rhizogenes]|uniref:hypothetical protein n=1 Tax=Rhizobium rhizogenes TaxID=359 RepID=UPI00157267CE|nr:hypothetical protein [Rhizobium rhizogenes]NTI22023.1 hypothetical protein [Rhizobium rhizogenes]QTG05630.1 hypothetical protein G6M87_09125 [Rhizobium rhizogenes]